MLLRTSTQPPAPGETARRCPALFYKSVMHTQVVNEYQVKSLVDAPCGALAWQPQMLEAIGKLQPDFRQASLRAQALLAQNTLGKVLTSY